METVDALVYEMQRLIDAAAGSQLHLRAFGGLAIFMHSRGNPKAFKRESPDLDFLVPRRERQMLEPFFRGVGYSPDKPFNLLNGMRRQIYYHDDIRDLHIDILIGDFEMCHKIPLDGRLEVDPVTIPLADLFLTKAQVVELNQKDALDIISLLLNNEIGVEGQAVLGIERVVDLCAHDWGLYKTTSMNLTRVEELLSKDELGLTSDEKDRVLGRIQKIRNGFDQMPKSLAWQMRDKVGTRVRWYSEVEEVDQ